MVSDKGNLLTPDPKPGKTLDMETVSLLIDYLHDDGISRSIPGMTGCVSVKEGDKKRKCKEGC